MLDSINRVRMCERMLLDGCTYYELADALCANVKTARRMVALLCDLGAVVDAYQESQKHPHVLKMRKNTRVFRA